MRELIGHRKMSLCQSFAQDSSNRYFRAIFKTMSCNKRTWHGIKIDLRPEKFYFIHTLKFFFTNFFTYGNILHPDKLLPKLSQHMGLTRPRRTNTVNRMTGCQDKGQHLFKESLLVFAYHMWLIVYIHRHFRYHH